MKILITYVEDSDSGCRVRFECECGNGDAFWVGPPPILGEHRFVELEIDAPLEIGRDIAETDEPVGLSIKDACSVLVGEISQIEKEGYVRMDLGCSGIDLEVTGTPPRMHGRYRAVTATLRVFDCAY